MSYGLHLSAQWKMRVFGLVQNYDFITSCMNHRLHIMIIISAVTCASLFNSSQFGRCFLVHMAKSIPQNSRTLLPGFIFDLNIRIEQPLKTGLFLFFDYYIQTCKKPKTYWALFCNRSTLNSVNNFLVGCRFDS